MEKDKERIGWECTDPNTGQFCKKIDDFRYLYVDRWEEDDDADMIDVKSLSIRGIEKAINSFGYTLATSVEDKKDLINIIEQYPENYLQIIAECVFELNQ